MAGPRRISSPRARSWRATFSAAAISPGSACRSARCSAASRAGRRRGMPATDVREIDVLDTATRRATYDDARRDMDICNACRYCEGFCAVFPAMERRRAFSDADLEYLANLCHNCRGCYYACQYAPPHEFGINIPRTFAELRTKSYAKYAWPAPLARLFLKNGTVVSLVTALGMALVLALTIALVA